MQGTEDLLERALSGDARATAGLVLQLTPVIRARVERTLLRHRAQHVRARHELCDLSQDVLVQLFRDRARVLRAWDPSRGVPLSNFVALVAERQVSALLRSRRRSALGELSDPHSLEAAIAPDCDEERAVSRQLCRKLLASLAERLGERGFDLFVRLFVEEQPVEQVQRECSLSAAAIYQWRTRLQKLSREAALEIDARLNRDCQNREPLAQV